MLKSLENYFLGKGIISYYNELKRDYPDMTKQFNRERNKYIAFGKVIPDLMDVSAVALFIFNNPLSAAVLVGAGEGLRSCISDEFRWKQYKHTCDGIVSMIKEGIDKRRPAP